MYLVPHFGHAKVYETSIWTPCFQILTKTMHLEALKINFVVDGLDLKATIAVMSSLGWLGCEYRSQ